MAQAAIVALLGHTIGLNPDVVGAETIARAVRQRMAQCGTSDMQTYLERLQTSEQELHALIDEVVVPETWFFRDQTPFAYLGQYVMAEWLPSHQHGVLRVLSLACSTGAEPYSIAMALLDTGLTPQHFRIDAVDISQKALHWARCAVYGRHAFRGDDLVLRTAIAPPGAAHRNCPRHTGGVYCPPQVPPVWRGGSSAIVFRERYFEPSNEGYRICERVRDLVTFIHGNVLDAHLLADQAPYDAIFCRNMFIYFDAPARSRAMKVLDRLLTPAGLLCVGSAETGLFLASGYMPVRYPRAFAYRKAGAATTPSSSPSPSPPPTSGRGEIQKSTPERPCSPGDAQASALETAGRLADQGALDAAATLCESSIRAHGPSAQAYVLLGLIRQAAGNTAQAEHCFGRAVYLQPDHYEGLMHLALLMEHRGDTAMATVIRQRAQRAQHHAR